jgi:ubiquinone/menaquinone biosynthesis C-methylase UbiE
MIMSTDNEVDRLIKVYRKYGQTEEAGKRWSDANAGNRAIREERERVLGCMLEENGYLPLVNRRILDIGSGSGKNLVSLMQWGALPENLFGVDLMAERIAGAKQCFPGIQFTQGNAEQLNFDEHSFDLILLFTVFTSILDNSMARNVAEEAQRVLKPKGAIVGMTFPITTPSITMCGECPKQRYNCFSLNLVLSCELLPYYRHWQGDWVPQHRYYILCYRVYHSYTPTMHAYW